MVVVAGSLVACGDRYEPHGTFLEPPMSAPDFTLASAEGEVSKADFEGQVVVMFFGFRNCPDVCPDTMSRLSRAVRALDEHEARDVQVLLVSVDPERDPPDQIQRYAETFHPSFIGLTGSPEQIQHVASSYGIYFEQVPTNDGASYTVDHTAATVVLNRNGDTVLIWSYGTESQDIAADLRFLLNR